MTSAVEVACSGISCPACGSVEIVTTHDLMHNLHILKCCGCGEMYAISDEDLCNIGFERVVREWHGSYAHQKRLEVHDD